MSEQNHGPNTKRRARVGDAVYRSRVGIWTFALVVTFVIASMFFAVRGLTDLATASLGAATVIAGGGAATTAASHGAQNKAAASNGDSEPASS